METGVPLVGALCGWGMGGGMIAFAMQEWRRWRCIVRKGMPVTGTVMKIVCDPKGYQWMLIEYRVGTATHHFHAYRWAEQPGAAVPLLVDPSEPGTAHVWGAERSILHGVLVLWAFGLFLCAAGTAFVASLVRD